MTARPLPNLMYHIFVQKHSLSGLEQDTFFQCLKFSVAFKDINKLKVFMPMQNLKARIARDTFLFVYIQHKIGKRCARIQVDGVDILA